MNKKATWTQKDLKEAMLAIDRGKGKRESARNFGIPYSTLKDRLKTKNTSSAKYVTSGDETIKDLCDDNSEGEIDEFENELCILCNEFGKTEMWFRCGVCKKWAHKECTGHDDYKTYICDFCK